MTAKTVLITSVGSTTGISVIKALRQQTELPLTVIGVDGGPSYEVAGSVLADHFEQVPMAADPDFVAAMLQLVREHEVAAIFPISDIEVEVLAGHASAFAALGAHVFAAEASAVQACNDKLRTVAELTKAGLPTPQSWDKDSLEPDVAFPLIVKPARGVSSRGLSFVNSATQLVDALIDIDEPIIQRFIEGEEFTIDVTASKTGEVLAAVPRVRTEVKAGICTKGHTVSRPDLVDLAHQVAECFSLRGAANVQIIDGPEGPSVIEINPRFAATSTLTVAAGINGPLLLLKDLFDLEITEQERTYEPDVYMARYWDETFHRIAP